MYWVVWNVVDHDDEYLVTNVLDNQSLSIFVAFEHIKKDGNYQSNEDSLPLPLHQQAHHHHAVMHHGHSMLSG
jgi:hypothetical protein